MEVKRIYGIQAFVYVFAGKYNNVRIPFFNFGFKNNSDLNNPTNEVDS